MTERFLAEPDPQRPAQLEQLQALREHVAASLAESPWLQGMGGRIVGMGGTARNLAAAAQRLAGLPSSGVQGFVLSAEALSELIERLAALPAKERARLQGIKPSRADLVLAGAIVIEGVLSAGGFDGLEVTEAGLREGVFFERHLRGSRPRGDGPGGDGPGGDGPGGDGPGGDGPGGDGPGVSRPPMYADVRKAGVLNLSRRYGMDAPHSRHVAELALEMFDELAAQGLHAGDPVERELLWAACMLHDIGMSVDYDDHHKHSRYLILNGGLPGFSPTELAIVAQAARYHRKGMPEPGFLSPLFGKDDLATLDRCAALLRLAEDLERSRDQLVRQASLAAANGGVRLQLVADGETAVPRWAAGREGELFQRAFGRRLDIAA
jgi:exopolyphosphatase/guanosine-5'-triphosphate,3'-diphosphate pyrophosphatase